ncbi:hypothetical protein M011DRAFT_448926 [Sporormia fimetaria CBS 119925]|uniref:Transcription initiation factor IIE subunit beta n=1 Tax=Sporormia fimetaria CBS 119925 TaxID=1340428 RepID=A0A6A6V5T0_9PLEO|nr:hypothetical protein M011DRAFT_448926 [Sporormia fimetaria CBS 119925]
MSYLNPSSRSSAPAPSPTPSAVSTNGAKRKYADDKDKKVVYSQPISQGPGGEIFSKVLHVKDQLQQTRKWETHAQVMAWAGILTNDTATEKKILPTLRSSHESNRIEWDPKTNMYRYRPKLPVSNEEELMALLQKRTSAVGVSVKDLKDGWPDAPSAIDDMEANNELLVLRYQKDQQPKTVWLNDPHLKTKMDPRFKADWHAIKLPEDEELRATLQIAGIKPSSAPKRVMAATKEKKKKAVRSRGKKTNTHMDFLTKELAHLKK